MVLVNPMKVRAVPLYTKSKMRVSEMFIVGIMDEKEYERSYKPEQKEVCTRPDAHPYKCKCPEVASFKESKDERIQKLAHKLGSCSFFVKTPLYELEQIATKLIETFNVF